MADAPILWGFDISKKRTSIAFGAPGEKPSFTSIESNEGDENRRVIARIMVGMKDLLAMGRPADIWVERPLEHGFEAQVDFDARTVKQRRGIIAAFALKSIFDGIGAWAELASIRFHDVAPSTARKEFLGDGRLPRKQAKLRARAMCSVLNWGAENEDEADAACIWHYGAVRLAPYQATPIHGGLHMKAATLAAARAPAIFANVSDEVPW